LEVAKRLLLDGDLDIEIVYIPVVEGSLEVKLSTLWTDGKAEVRRVREEKGRRKKIREEKSQREEVRRRQMQVRV
jgi:hypothetical protein